MSTRGSTYWDDPDQPIMQWVVDAKPWCRQCCTANCGCPANERLIAEMRAEFETHIVRGEE